jgi:anti-sigma B factor antagonist
MDVTTELGDRLVELIEPDTKQMVLDLTGLDFISSVGLGGIIAAHLRCSKQGGVVRLVRPQPEIEHVLAVTKLTSLFPIHASVDEAIAAA